MKKVLKFGALYLNRLYSGGGGDRMMYWPYETRWFPTFNYSINIYYFPTVYQPLARQWSGEQKRPSPYPRRALFSIVIDINMWHENIKKSKLHTFKLLLHAKHCIKSFIQIDLILTKIRVVGNYCYPHFLDGGNSVPCCGTMDEEVFSESCSLCFLLVTLTVFQYSRW